MKIICAWCGKILSKELDSSDKENSHGICKTCEDKMREELKERKERKNGLNS